MASFFGGLRRNNVGFGRIDMEEAKILSDVVQSLCYRSHKSSQCLSKLACLAHAGCCTADIISWLAMICRGIASAPSGSFTCNLLRASKSPAVNVLT